MSCLSLWFKNILQPPRTNMTNVTHHLGSFNFTNFETTNARVVLVAVVFLIMQLLRITIMSCNSLSWFFLGSVALWTRIMNYSSSSWFFFQCTYLPNQDDKCNLSSWFFLMLQLVKPRWWVPCSLSWFLKFCSFYELGWWMQFVILVFLVLLLKPRRWASCSLSLFAFIVQLPRTTTTNCSSSSWLFFSSCSLVKQDDKLQFIVLVLFSMYQVQLVVLVFL